MNGKQKFKLNGEEAYEVATLFNRIVVAERFMREHLDVNDMKSYANWKGARNEAALALRNKYGITHIGTASLTNQQLAA